jgi:hypothetical protein
VKARAGIALVFLLVGGAIALDRISPASPAQRATVSLSPDAGILSCPYLTEPTGAALLHFANVGSSPATVRIGIPQVKGGYLTLAKDVPAGSAQTIRVPSRVAARAGAVVEYSGGTVVVSHTLILPAVGGPVSRGAGAAVAPCERAGGSDVVVAQARTFGADAPLALFNPGSADADVSVTLLADGRLLQPQRLARRVVPSHARRDFKLGDFAFNAKNLTAIVHANAGRVVAEILLRTRNGVEFLPGQVPSNELVAIAGQSGVGSSAGVTVIGQDDTGIDVGLISAIAQTSAGAFPPSLPPAGGRHVTIPDQGKQAGAAYIFHVNVGSPLVAGTTWLASRAGGTDEAGLPAATPALRWAGVFGALETTATNRAIIVNPGGVPVHVRVLLLASHTSQNRDLVIPAGRLIELPVGLGSGTFAVSVDADAPVVLAMRSVGLVRAGFLTALDLIGTPLPMPADVAVSIDPRAGVPAVLPTR